MEFAKRVSFRLNLERATTGKLSQERIEQVILQELKESVPAKYNAPLADSMVERVEKFFEGRL